MRGPTWLSGVDKWPRAIPDFEVVLQRSALVIVDVQNYLTRDDLGLAARFAELFPEEASKYFRRVEQEVIPNTKRLLNAFRSKSRPIVFLAFGAHRADGLDALSPKRQRDAMQQTQGSRTLPILGTEEHDICPQLEPGPNEPILTKVTSGGFLSTGLDTVLRNLRVTDVVITGLLSNGCVESTMNEAADRGYRTVVAEDACASFDMEAHRATLRNFRRLRGLVGSTTEILSELGAETGMAV